MAELNPSIIVIFGASGDLAHIKIFPALYSLWEDGFFPDSFFIVGFARTNMDDEAFRKTIFDNLNVNCRKKPINEDDFINFSKHIFYLTSKYDDELSYQKLGKFITRKASEYKMPKNIVYYLSTPPSVYEDVIDNIKNADLISSKFKGDSFSKIVIEKPFGYDYESAKNLNGKLLSVFKEDEVYRIDHYLGKETVQNILAFRFANAIFEPIWNNKYIDHIQISALESIGVGFRAGYFDKSGIIRDMMQNHMMQLLSLVAIEPPPLLDADDIRNEKVKLLKSVRPFSLNDVKNFAARGQYDRGLINNKPVISYKEEKGVPINSLTETYAALRLFIDNYRWAGVPFYLRSGKRLKKHKTEIAVFFKKLPYSLYGKNGMERIKQNSIIITIQPNEGISINFGAKTPGFKMDIEPVNMVFNYKSSFKLSPPDAYERLLYDIIIGDQTLFARYDDMLIAWQLITSIINGWSKIEPPAFPNYEAGSWGPKEADDLINADGRFWNNN
ncbi:MAG: glucose-6-phosphate dehydrogenase [Deltaproteobacteria bacterium]|jgi:glucose-6-phosphate 1-dehydrogenase|nr:glucose-6-phosphate dehydrogenase [Deltaproteobacteria bacterium]MCL5880452.1 glucose-6-phosphate dehydrogenase [Deltaproteobacteria bacterium]MDA8304633.1 glucose-6-phosphate dehydrogenase [Deltaproteobacteria bacterium]